MTIPTTPIVQEEGMNDCHAAARRLWDFIDGRLSAMSRDDMLAHLARCESCSSHVAFARLLKNALAASAQSPSREDTARLRALVRRTLASAGMVP